MLLCKANGIEQQTTVHLVVNQGSLTSPLNRNEKQPLFSVNSGAKIGILYANAILH